MKKLILIASICAFIMNCASPGLTSARVYYHQQDYKSSFNMAVDNLQTVKPEEVPELYKLIIKSAYQSKLYDVVIKYFESAGAHQASIMSDQLNTYYVAISYYMQKEYSEANSLFNKIRSYGNVTESWIPTIQVQLYLSENKTYSELKQVFPEADSHVFISIKNVDLKGKTGYNFSQIINLYKKGEILTASEFMIKESEIVAISKKLNYYPFSTSYKVIINNLVKQKDVIGLQKLADEIESSITLLKDYYSYWSLISFNYAKRQIEEKVDEIKHLNLEEKIAANELNIYRTEELISLIYSGKDKSKYHSALNKVADYLLGQPLPKEIKDDIRYQKSAMVYYSEKGWNYDVIPEKAMQNFRNNTFQTDSVEIKNQYMIARTLREMNKTELAARYYKAFYKQYPNTRFSDDAMFMEAVIANNDELESKLLVKFLNRYNESDKRAYAEGILLYYYLHSNQPEKIFEIVEQREKTDTTFNSSYWKFNAFMLQKESKKAFDILPEHSNNNYKAIAGQAFFSGNRDEAIKYINKCTEVSDSKKIKYVAQLYNSGNLDEYLDSVYSVPKEWLEKLSDNPEKLLKQADGINRWDSLDYKFALLHKARKTNPAYSIVNYKLGAMCKGRGYNSAAFVLFSQVDKNSKEYVSALIGLAVLKKSVWLIEDAKILLENALIAEEDANKKAEIILRLFNNTIDNDEKLKYIEQALNIVQSEHHKIQYLIEYLNLLYFGFHDYDKVIELFNTYISNGIVPSRNLVKIVSDSYLMKNDYKNSGFVYERYFPDKINVVGIQYLKLSDHMYYIEKQPEAAKYCLQKAKEILHEKSMFSSALQRRIELYMQ